MARAKRLHKSRNDKMISGVAGGMAEYFDIDPVFVRLGWVLSVFVTGGISILVYLVMVFVVPKRAYAPSASGDVTQDDGVSVGEYAVESDDTNHPRRERNRRWLGIGLVIAGVAILLNNMNILGLRSIEWGILAAIAVIALGAVLLFMSLRNRN